MKNNVFLHYKSMYFATQTTAFIYILRYKTLNTQRKIP